MTSTDDIRSMANLGLFEKAKEKCEEILFPSELIEGKKNKELEAKVKELYGYVMLELGFYEEALKHLKHCSCHVCSFNAATATTMLQVSSGEVLHEDNFKVVSNEHFKQMERKDLVVFNTALGHVRRGSHVDAVLSLEAFAKSLLLKSQKKRRKSVDCRNNDSLLLCHALSDCDEEFKRLKSLQLLASLYVENDTECARVLFASLPEDEEFGLFRTVSSGNVSVILAPETKPSLCYAHTLFQKGEFELCVSYLKRYFGGFSVSSLHLMGCCFFRQKLFQQALSSLRQAVYSASSQNNVCFDLLFNFYVCLMACHAPLQQQMEVLQLLVQCMDSTELVVQREIYFRLANVLSYSKRENEALEYYEYAMNLGLPVARTEYAHCLISLEMFDKAIEVLDPSDELYFASLVRLNRLDALQDCLSKLERSEDWKKLNNAALIHVFFKRFEKALQILRKARQKHPTSPILTYNLVLLLLHQHRTNDAIAVWVPFSQNNQQMSHTKSSQNSSRENLLFGEFDRMELDKTLGKNHNETSEFKKYLLTMK